MSSNPVPTLAQLDAALDAHPDNPEILHERGIWMLNNGRFNEALVCLDLSSIIYPGHAHTYVTRAACLINMNRAEEALEPCSRALAIDPNCADALLNRGAAYIMLKKPDEAIVDLQHALTLREDPRGIVNLCAAYHLQGRHEEALKGYRRVLEVDPKLYVARSSLIACLDFLIEDGFDAFQAERKEYGKQHGNVQQLGLLQDKDPNRRITIGYVGADFRYHSAAFCFKPIIGYRDKDKFQVNIYSGVTAPDQMTKWFMENVDIWRDTIGMTDFGLAQQIRNDQVDILVDLSGHSVGNKLMAFAHKPAPIQITAWGHGGGTGLPQMDYQFTDPVWIPTWARHLFTEKCWDLPCFITFEPPAMGPEIRPLPALENGYITFGCMNRYQKVTTKAEALWAKILLAVPDSRLLLKDGVFDSEDERNALRLRFKEHGVDPDRISFMGITSHWDHMNSYGLADIMLDPFPMGGGITTWEALYMGVPTITELGTTQASRITGAIQCALRLDAFCCIGKDNYLDLAVRMAKDYAYLDKLRKQLRVRVAGSAAGNPKEYTKHVEDAYLTMWKDWCSK